MQSSVCSKIKKEREENFDNIEQYLKKYPNSNALQIAEGTGISIYDIVACIEEGRLNRSKGVFSRI